MIDQLGKVSVLINHQLVKVSVLVNLLVNLILVNLVECSRH